MPAIWLAACTWSVDDVSAWWITSRVDSLSAAHTRHSALFLGLMFFVSTPLGRFHSLHLILSWKNSVKIAPMLVSYSFQIPIINKAKTFFVHCIVHRTLHWGNYAWSPWLPNSWSVNWLLSNTPWFKVCCPYFYYVFKCIEQFRGPILRW